MNVRLNWSIATSMGLVIAALATIGLAQSQTPQSQTPQSQIAQLRSPSDFAQIADRNDRSAAIFVEMGKVIQHPRCLNCHPRGDRPTQQNGRPHIPPVQRGPASFGVTGMECAVCHGPTNVPFVNGQDGIPGHPAWHLAPREMAWQGLSLRAICQQLKDRRRNGGKSLAELQHHNAHDSLVGWGWNPGAGRAPAPGTQQQFGELTQAWIDAGASCPKR